jgi:hypothetical protein
MSDINEVFILKLLYGFNFSVCLKCFYTTFELNFVRFLKDESSYGKLVGLHNITQRPN